MLNEGAVISSSKIQIKSMIIHHLRQLGPTDPERLERAAFHALTGHRREEIDFSEQCNQAGYHEWVRSFDRLVSELVEDGYIQRERFGGGDAQRLVPLEADPPVF